MSDFADTLTLIKFEHRKRRFAMKTQQKMDRSLESFIRINCTDWSPDLDAKAAEKENKKVSRIIKAALGALESGEDEIVTGIRPLVEMNEKARAPSDDLRKHAEKRMEKAAKSLPVYVWAKGVRGFGEVGLATILAETGDLSKYANPAKVWKRLGFAPYQGAAGSTWKRATWRERALTADEWTENPFNGERYALMFMIAESLFKAQWIGKGKTEDGQGKPNGRYGEVYAARRAHTAVTHPEWTPQHAQRDALRVMMKRLLADLWQEWNHPAPAVEMLDAAE